MSAPFSISTGKITPLGEFSYRTSVVLPFPPLPTPHRRGSDRAVVTWVAGDAAYRWFSVTGPAMKRYADRTGADLVVLEGHAGQPFPLINKFRVRQVFEEYGYDVVLFVDADALIRDHCVNFFDLVPEGLVGILDEGPYYDEWMLVNYRREAAALLLSQGYDVDYAAIPSPKNSGLYLIHACQKHILTPFSQPFPICSRGGATVEQTWLALMLQQAEIPLFPFEYPQHHWLWYLDQEEKAVDDAMVLHFAGLHDLGDRRYRRLAANASREAGGRPQRVGGPDSTPEVFIPSFDRQLMLDPPGPAVLKMLGTYTIDTHRYGWSVAVKSLSVLENFSGVAFDGFLEGTFLYHPEETEAAGIAPYREPWMGFIHNPPGVPEWPSIAEGRLQTLETTPLWLESLPRCLGLFALTEYLADWVRAEWGLPCEVLRYPTLTPDKRFSMDAFEAQARPVVATIGFWLRRFTTFERLRAGGFLKVQPDLMPSDNLEGTRRIRAYERDEATAWRGRGAGGTQPVERLPRLTDDAYDDLLSRSVIFLDLIDASAVTTVVECLARATPLLINRHPAVVEYLGADYPFYFDSLEEAECKLADRCLIWAAHRHMLSNPIVRQLAPQAFLDAFAATQLYQKALSSLPVSLRI
ncbi:MAG TPA: hypothetical protein VFB58_17585 [Chloroflexota bacterium]|nr:hypothetical protein [Chloroflexota bacterium]